MPAAADVSRRLARPLGVLAVGALSVGMLALGLTACASATSASSAMVSSSPPLPSATVVSSAASSAALPLVQAAITRFNQTAGGSVDDQQSVLRTLIASGQSAEQKACPTATTTIELEPVYARLAATPEWHPASGALAGTVYELPTLIRIYTGDRITGTDLADLHVTVDGGQVKFPAICLR